MDVGSAAQETNEAGTVDAIRDEARILSFNVGHGDCTLVEYHHMGVPSFRCLIDAGESLPSSLLDHLRRNRRHDGGPDIDVLMLSHVDADHQGGLPGLMAPDIWIGEYFGPCLPAFERLASLFEQRVQAAVARARDFETMLAARSVPIVYPLEGFSKAYVSGRVTLAVLSPAAKLLEKLYTGNGAELANLLMRRPLPLDWLEAAGSDDGPDDNGGLRDIFRRGPGVFPQDFPSRPPRLAGIDRQDLHRAAGSTGAAEPDFFGNSVLNDTSLVVAIDVHLDGVRRKRILLTGDQENWSYLAARHPGGLGPDVLKAPHHGGRVYLRDRTVDIDSLYLWLRPRTVIVSASGRHDLPRLAFRDAMRATGATLFCPNIRGIEPLTAGAVASKDASCYKSYACSTPKPGGFSTLRLHAQDERANTYSCVQGSLHTAPAPIVVIRQEIASPSEKIVRYTWGELERNATWLQRELQKRHKDFIERAPHAPKHIIVRKDQELVTWDSIIPAARAAGMHQLVVDPGPVLRYARAYRKFWASADAPQEGKPFHLYRPVTRGMLKKASTWVNRIPRMLLHAPLTPQRIATGDKLDILGKAKWNVLDGLLAHLLALPQDVIKDEVRPALLPLIGEKFSAKACSGANPAAQFITGPEEQAYLWLEHRKTRQAFPDLEDDDWAEWNNALAYRRDEASEWQRVDTTAVNHILLGNYTFGETYGSRGNWMKKFQMNPNYPDPFDQAFKNARWTPLW